MVILARICCFLAVLAAAAAAGAGVLYRRASVALWAGRDGERAGETLVARFLKAQPGLKSLPLAAGRDELIDPATALPRAFAFPAADLRRLEAYQERCAGAGTVGGGALLAKAWRWAQARCGQGEPLGADFFREPPYMHPSGQSYATLALATGDAPYRDARFRAATREFRHFLERARDGDPAVPAWLGRGALGAIRGGERAVLAGGFVLFARPEPGAGYAVAPRALWDAFTADAPVRLVERGADPACRAPARYCWSVVASSLAGKAAELWRAMVAGAAAALLLFCAWGGLRVAVAGRSRRERFQMMRILAHELRTPATSLGLSVDEMRADFDGFPARSQSAFLRLASDVQRLRRVVESSARLTRRDAPRADAGRRRIPSAAAFVEAVAEPIGMRHDQTIACALPNGDFAAVLDPYWLELALSNLLDNALRHGRMPVTASCEATAAAYIFKVSDAGVFAASAGGGGLGMGLAIVGDAVKALGGTMAVAVAPTCFTVKVPRRAGGP